MADAFELAIAPVLGREAGYVDNPDDHGGPTIWGVTEAVARQYGYTGDMRAMSREQAKAILRQECWTGPGLDKVAVLSQRVAGELLDIAVNMGPGVGGPWLQRALNVLNRRAADYPDVTVDGHLGPATLQALGGLIRARGLVLAERVTLIALNCLKGARYIALAEARQADETFELGWLANRIGLG